MFSPYSNNNLQSSVALPLENGWNFWCVLTVKSEVSELHITSVLQ
jgi:hypothetical protein